MKNILIVEDNELNLKLFKDVLIFKGYAVDCATDGEEAYNKISKNKYNLVVLDVQLPKMDGFEVIKKLKKNNIKIPDIIMVSACAMDEDKLKAKQFGIDTYLTKPVDLNKFLDTIGRTIS